MKNWTMRLRIVLSFAIILALMIGMTTIGLTRLAAIDSLTDSVEKDSMAGLQVSNDIRANRIRNYAMTEQYVIDSGMPEKERLHSAIIAGRRHTDDLMTLYKTTIFTPEEQELFDEYKVLQVAYRTSQDEVLETGRDPRNKSTAMTQIDARLTPEFEKGINAFDGIVDHNTRSAKAAIQRVHDAVGQARLAAFLAVGVALLIAVICGYLLLRTVTKPLGRLIGVLDVMRTGDLSERLTHDSTNEFGVLARGFNRMTDELTGLVGQVQKSGIQVNVSVTEIAATTRQQQITATEIAATTTEVSATAREITTSSKQLVATMNEVSTVADQSAVLAGHGQTGLIHMEESMRQVMSAVGFITATLAVLSEKAANISHVVMTITKVADQTNLLSLNAAIEAEKAGEYGRGFSVVATEIRRLADQTAVATYDIEQTVKEIQGAVKASVMGMDKFSNEIGRSVEEVQQVGSQLSQVIHQVQALAPRIESVTESVHAQAIGAEQIARGLTHLSEAAQQTVQSLHQSTEVIEDLNEVAASLRTEVSRFTLQAAA